MAILSIVLLSLAGIALLLSLIFDLECVAHSFLKKATGEPQGVRPKLAILVPAHNEEAVLGRTLESIKAQLEPIDRVLVVADNCSDRTAEVAREYGVEVSERFHDTERGKGYALAHGLQQLEENTPDVVIFLDADCQLEEGALDHLAWTAMSSRRPVQAIYTMGLPPNPSAKDRVSCFAFYVKNQVRAGGLHVLGLPTHLTGTGMALPWKIVSRVDFATGHLVEDMHLGLEFALKGTPPRLEPNARVTSVLPDRSEAATSQRTRWEHGHLQTIRTQFPRLLARGLSKDPRCLALALDLLVPPLAFLVMFMAGVGGISVLAGLIGLGWVPSLMVLIGVLAAWAEGGNRILSLKDLASIPAYMLWKLPFYKKFFSGSSEKEWVRTARDEETQEENVIPPIDKGSEAPVSMVLGQLFDTITMEETMTACQEAMRGSRPRYFVTANCDFLARSADDLELKQLLFNADRILCDGMPVYWISKALGVGLPERVAGSDLVSPLLEYCGKAELSVFLFGCAPETIEELKEKLPKAYPGLKIAGAISPPFGSIESWDNEEYVRIIREASPNLLLAALGFPKQERWISQFHEEYGTPLSIGIGASLDFLVNKQVRAPRFLQKIGLEWFWRMMLSPQRLAPRYYKDFKALSKLIKAHFRAFRSSGNAPSKREAVEGAISCPTQYTSEFEEQIRSFEGEEIPLDCAWIAPVDSVVISRIFRAQRFAKSVGKHLVLRNAPPVLERYWAEFQLQPVFPLKAGAATSSQGTGTTEEFPQAGPIVRGTPRA